ncbi:allantoin permease [[Candida] railenensis]|uniref:Allantoin permease n=1 Tax=[Candida] railenensis TaxID=45579 RepID=A0A9P0VX50_9ASCO|nr:allantoin permease [[Candida] railenensis]
MSLDKKNNYTSEEDAGESIQGDVTSLNTSQSKWEKFLDYIAVQEKGDLTTVQMFLYNHDLRPVEEARRAWSWYNYVFFWVADSFNVNTWQIAATGVQNGMTWWQTWLSVWVGYILCGIFVTLGARIGVLYHISFPVAARSSFGIYGSLWPILNRVVMSCVWYSVQGWIGGQCVQLMLLSIFHNADKKLDTPLQGGADVLTTFKFLGYFLFWLFSLPAIWFHPHQIRHLFTFKAYVVPFAGIGFLIWTLVKAKGAGPVIHEKSSKHGSELGWLFIESTLNSLANFATLIVNAPDFARFADKPSFGIKYLVHTVSIPLCFSITSLIGILVSSASTILYGETLWSPLDVLGKFLDHYTSGNRAGVFFISAAFALAQLGTNISANSLSFGTDCTAMLPRFINIRRGGYLCAALALCICPWNLMTSSSMFTTYLSAYSVFLSSIAGVVACDYFYIRRGYIKLTHLYSLHAPEQPSAPSFYKFGPIGVNWRAYVAYICGILPNIVGFVGATETHTVPIGATEVYRLSFIMGFFSAFLIYALLNYFSPVAGIPPVKPFEKGWFEEWQDVEDFEEEIQGHVMPQTSALEKTLSYEGGRHKKTASEF